MGLLAALATSCASGSDPMASSRVQVVHTTSGLAFVRGAEQYPDGKFGCGLRRAVDGVPDAERHAEAHSHLLMGAFVLELGSLLLTGAAVANAAQVDESGKALDTSMALAGGAVVLSVVSSTLYERSAPHVSQAVTIYNDEMRRAASGKGHSEPAQSDEGTSMLQPAR